jgi:hypothetical protein
MALDRKLEIAARHALAVVDDTNEPPPAAVGRHLDPRGAGVERVFHQFLHHARRTLDHFARGDAVDGGLGKLADGHRADLIRCPADSTGMRAAPRG